MRAACVRVLQCHVTGAVHCVCVSVGPHQVQPAIVCSIRRQRYKQLRTLTLRSRGLRRGHLTRRLPIRDTETKRQLLRIVVRHANQRLRGVKVRLSHHRGDECRSQEETLNSYIQLQKRGEKRV